MGRTVSDVWFNGSDSGSNSLTVSSTQPSDPKDGDVWIDKSTDLGLPVTSGDVTNIVKLTQAEYDALSSYDAETVYYITT